MVNQRSKKKKTSRAKASWSRAEGRSKGTGNCKICKGAIRVGRKCRLGWIYPDRYQRKTCPKCYEDEKCLAVSPSYTNAQCATMLTLIHDDFGRLLVKYGINEINKIGSPIDDSKPFHFYKDNAGTVGKLLKGYYSSKEWKKEHPGVSKQAPFSNFFSTKDKTYEIQGIGKKFKTTEAMIMFWKALLMGDGTIARCLGVYGDSLAGTMSKGLGRMVTPFDKTIWCPKVVAMYVTLIKWDQCPVFQAEMRRIHAEDYTSIHECSPNDSIWGTGSAVGEPLGSSNGVGGENILGKAQTTILQIV